MTLEPTAVAKRLRNYIRPSVGRGVLELVVTAAPLFAISVLAWIALQHRVWWGLILIAPASAFLVRLFMIQHDCSHGAFFR
jgi:omega-6 fatty acid desaturase (delta-12 desaturase)